MTVAEILDRGQRRVSVNMAGAAAVTQLFDRIKAIRIFIFLVLTHTIFTAMTGRALRLQISALPADRFTVAAMAVATVQRAAVFARITRRLVAKLQWRPAAGAMAMVAFQRGDEMPIRLADGFDTVMATGATASHPAVIETGRTPASGGMTQFTVIAADNVIHRFTNGGHTIMTTETAVANTAVIETGWRPGYCGMA